jgi:hypothetical protein
MKTKVNVRVSHLRIYDATREEKTVNGTTVYRDGALILADEVGGTTAVKLSAKQLNNLAGIANVNRPGREGWLVLKGLIGVDRSTANVTIESYKEGDEYAKADGTVGKHTKTGENVSVDTIVIHPFVQKKMDDAIVKVAIGWNTYTLPTIESLKDGSADGMD